MLGSPSTIFPNENNELQQYKRATQGTLSSVQEDGKQIKTRLAWPGHLVLTYNF
jgi:hypothetical protein